MSQYAAPHEYHSRSSCQDAPSRQDALSLSAHPVDAEEQSSYRHDIRKGAKRLPSDLRVLPAHGQQSEESRYTSPRGHTVGERGLAQLSRTPHGHGEPYAADQDRHVDRSRPSTVKCLQSIASTVGVARCGSQGEARTASRDKKATPAFSADAHIHSEGGSAHIQSEDEFFNELDGLRIYEKEVATLLSRIMKYTQAEETALQDMLNGYPDDPSSWHERNEDKQLPLRRAILKNIVSPNQITGPHKGKGNGAPHVEGDRKCSNGCDHAATDLERQRLVESYEHHMHSLKAIRRKIVKFAWVRFHRFLEVSPQDASFLTFTTVQWPLPSPPETPAHITSQALRLMLEETCFPTRYSTPFGALMAIKEKCAEALCEIRAGNWTGVAMDVLEGLERLHMACEELEREMSQ